MNQSIITNQQINKSSDRPIMRLTIIIPVDPCKNKFPNQIFVGKIIVLLNHLLSSNSCFCRRNISTTSSWPEIKEIPIK